MRCKKHLSDYSSGIGVCASCLRERLFYLIEAQAQAEAEAQGQTPQNQTRPRFHQSQSQSQSQSHHALQSSSSSHPSRFDDRRHHHHRNPDPPPPPPPLIFPRSVSPYITRRKSEKQFVDDSPVHHRLFFSTPQLGPTYRPNNHNNNNNYFKEQEEVDGNLDNSTKKTKKKWSSRFPVISDLLRFRSRWRKSSRHHTTTDPSPRVSSHPPSTYLRSSISDVTAAASTSSLNQHRGGSGSGSEPVSGSVPRRKNQKTMVRMYSLDDETAAASSRRQQRIVTRGMSPDFEELAAAAYEEEDDQDLAPPETPEHWRRTPTSTILRASQGRFRASPGRSSFGTVTNGWGLCLSPLVRASPVSRVLTSSGQELGYSGEIRPPSSSSSGGKPPHLSTNRSRKIADFGRFNHNR